MNAENLKIENGRLWYLGEGADGLRWYNIASEDETIANLFGNYDDEVTVKEAFEAGRLVVYDKPGDPASGTPYHTF